MAASCIPATARGFRGAWKLPQCSHRRFDVRMMASSTAADTATPALDALLSYHQDTKHSFQQFAKGPRGLDWANQPNPFRRYPGSTVVELDHFQEQIGTLPYAEVGTGAASPEKVTKSSLSQLFYDSLALSAWKSVGRSTWSLRVNPSSGNLHPTEGYLISGPVAGVSTTPFLAHYAPKEHALEIRAELPLELWESLKRGLPEGTILVGFSSIYWREAWKYGERAFRYCNHDVGHAIGSVAVAAAHLGWNVQLLDDFSTEELEHFLGLNSPSSVPSQGQNSANSESGGGFFPNLDKENADCLLAVFPWEKDSARVNRDLSSASAEILLRQFSALRFAGQANNLSKEHVQWDIIYRASAASHKPHTSDGGASFGLGSTPVPNTYINASVYEDYTVRQVVRRRRSAVDMDGKYGMQRNLFYQILLKATLGNPGMFPFGVLPWETEIHCALFVHRIVDLPQGLYILVRNQSHMHSLRQACSEKFQWVKPENCPEDLPLYRLLSGDARILAARLSCNQDIAGNSFFSLGMLARFQPALKEKGPWMYPRLFWEAGLLGQLLYLEATAMGVAATGIGCYFDDAVHEILGLNGKEFQSLYHFTVGVPLVDTRIMSLPAYPGPSYDA